MSTEEEPDVVWAVAAIAVVAACKAVLATRWDLLADEAYYALWSEHLALGYYDQPPLIAWILAATRAVLGDHDVALRLPAILAGCAGAAALLHWAKDRVLLAAWWVGIPSLAWLTGFATPDAFLLGCWAGAMSAAILGGPAWLLAGACVALGVYAKYTAILLLPLLWAGTGDWKSPWMWAGSALAALLLIPHAGWLASHDWVSVRFQLREGLVNPDAPGLTGPLGVVGQQLGVATPFGVLLGTAGLARAPLDRVDRVAWWCSAPVGMVFLLASFGGPPEAHWLAPFWIGVGLLASRGTAWMQRAGWLAVGTGLAGSALLVTHAEVGVVPLRIDPADRVREGRPLASSVAGWALPLGVGPREPRAVEATPVLTERYQEAALIWWYTGIPAAAYPGCGRRDQFDLWGVEVPETFLFVRPHTSGDAICPDATHASKTRHPLEGRDIRGRVVGRWDLFEVAR
ncbi:MAG: glycosyltransferase family 39 protein [Alphaproteobacteria bacterium]|nr:glycosyltransferase family 39 protein [Alphaproteobacteria bacterium]